MSQANQNPFQAPIKSTAKDSASPVSGEVLDFVVIARKWEKYRLIYNGILVVETVLLTVLLLLFSGMLPSIELPVLAVLGAVACNFFFLLGPVLDGYCQWIFKSRNRVFGLIVLVLGTLFSAMMAAVTVIGTFLNFM